MDRSIFQKMLLIESDSDEELEIIAKLAMEEERSTLHSASKRRCTFIMYDSLQAGKDLFRDYFTERPLYPHKYFRRRFRMSRLLLFKMWLKLTIFILSNEEMVPKDSVFLPFRRLLRHLGCLHMVLPLTLWTNT
jgi:hypothetical protein